MLWDCIDDMNMERGDGTYELKYIRTGFMFSSKLSTVK